jgi:hypothetical protein
MSTEKRLGLSKKNDSMLLTVALLLGLVAGIVVWKLTEGDGHDILVVPMVLVLTVGVYFLASMPFGSNDSDYIPSQRSFRLVWGALLTTVGALLLVNEYATVQLWILAVILIVVVAIVVLVLFMKGNKN